jgi:hypothetical protein
MNAIEISPYDAWELAFTRRLRELQPSMSVDEAKRICEEVFPAAASTPPENAAETFNAAFPQARAA